MPSRISDFLFVCFLQFSSYFVNGTTPEEAKSSICDNGHIISAVSRVKGEKDFAYLFTGPYMWKFDMENQSLVDVFDIDDRLNHSSVTYIEAGDYDDRISFYRLFNDKEMYDVNKSLTVYSIESFYAPLVDAFGASLSPLPVKNIAAFCSTKTDCTVLFERKNDRIYECRESKNRCKWIKSLRNPNKIEVTEQVEGILIDTDIDEKPLEWRLLIADKDKLRYWKDDTLMYTIYIGHLFDCPVSFVWFIIIACVMVAALVTVVAVALLLLTCRREQHFTGVKMATMASQNVDLTTAT